MVEHVVFVEGRCHGGAKVESVIIIPLRRSRLGFLNECLIRPVQLINRRHRSAERRRLQLLTTRDRAPLHVTFY